MKGWVSGTGKTAYFRARDARDSVDNESPGIFAGLLKESVVGRRVVSERARCLIPARIIGAEDECLTHIFVAPSFALVRMPLTVVRVRESYAVGSPLGKQKENQRHRKYATQAFYPHESPKSNLHNSRSLPTSFYAGNAHWFQNSHQSRRDDYERVLHENEARLVRAARITIESDRTRNRRFGSCFR